MSFHGQIRKLRSSPDGRPHVALGFRLGYWSCLKAPYVQLVLGNYRAEIWFGLPTYKKAA